MSRRHPLLRRAALGLGLLAFLGGPTPGAVGSCDEDLDGFVDLREYCKEREELVCVRRWLRKELTDEARDDCRREALSLCERRVWRPDCRPTERQARACLNALRAKGTVKTPEDELETCNREALCTVRESQDSNDSDAGSGP
ncbi:MAG: hypothetical protein OEZ06_06015 [Myxococcales bacterium]|nr:hypothetical protein [Myxococcales bacterium]